MDIFSNPFYLLKASVFDKRQRLVELADEQNLLSDSSAITEAYSILTNPRKRLQAEIAWMPGVKPQHALAILNILATSPEKLVSVENSHTISDPLARANILSATLAHLVSLGSKDVVVNWILAVIYAVDKVKSEDVIKVLNADRKIAGFAEVTELAPVEEALQNQRNYYRNVIKDTLNRLPSLDIVTVMHSVTDTATNYGKKTAPILLSDVIDMYEVEVEEFLTKERENIDTILKKMREAIKINKNNKKIFLVIDRLNAVIQNWYNVAYPIQICKKSLGLQYSTVLKLAYNIRNFCIEIFKEYFVVEIALQTTVILKKIFKDIDEIIEVASSDINELNKIKFLCSKQS